MSRNSMLDFYREIVNSEKSFGVDYKNLSKQLIERIDKAIEKLKEIRQRTFTKYNSNEWNNCLSFNDDIKSLLKILGDKGSE